MSLGGEKDQIQTDVEIAMLDLGTVILENVLKKKFLQSIHFVKLSILNQQLKYEHILKQNVERHYVNLISFKNSLLSLQPVNLELFL